MLAICSIRARPLLISMLYKLIVNKCNQLLTSCVDALEWAHQDEGRSERNT